MENKRTYKTSVENMKLKLRNVLRGHARLILNENDMTSTVDDKVVELRVVHEFLNYLDSFESKLVKDEQDDLDKLKRDLFEDMEH